MTAPEKNRGGQFFVCRERKNNREKNVSTAVEQEVTEQTAPAAEQTNDKLVKLAKPYKFDDEEYSEINLSGLDKLTIEDAVLTVKKLTGDGELAAMVMP